LVANKNDKVADREVTREKGEKFSIENKLAGFFETSAKTGDNVEATFATAAQMLFQ